MSKQDAGGMPTGRRKRGGLGGKKLRKKIEVGLHPHEKAWIKEAAAMRRITMSMYCAEHSSAAALKDIEKKNKEK
jgi:uncharacterized protein (DUF1778 family)